MDDRGLFEIGEAYTDPELYEIARYRGPFGRFRGWRERHLLRAFLERTAPGQSLLDCPAGVGRLFCEFRRHGLKVIGADLSHEMLRFAKKENGAGITGFLGARGDGLPLKDDAVDWVFSYALMKHLSPDVQMGTLSEFWRIARRGIAVSFAILDPVSFPRWWFRYRDRAEPSFPIPEMWIRLAADRLGLRIKRLGRVVPGLGMETLYLLTSRTSG